MQCLTASKAGVSVDEDLSKLQDTDHRPADGDRREPPHADTPAAPSSADGDRLSTIPEGDGDAEMILEEWAHELEAELVPAMDYEDFHAVPVKMMPDDTVLISYNLDDDHDYGDMRDDEGTVFLATEPDTSEMALPMGAAQEDEVYSLDSDNNIGEHIEFCFPQAMGKVILDEGQRESTTSADLVTMRIYVAAASKRAVVAKEKTTFSL